MIRLFLLVFFLCANMIALAQKDSIPSKNNDSITPDYRKPVKLTSAQQQWMNTNYKTIASLPKDSATKLIRKKFSTISESSLEYFISQSAKLQKGDNLEQLALLEQMLGQLGQQKEALLKKIKEKEDDLSKEKDPDKIKAITSFILQLRKQLRGLEDHIRSKEENVRKIKTDYKLDVLPP